MSFEALARADTPVVRLVQQTLADAIQKGASDVHFEPYEHCYRIRYRQDGLLHEVSSPPLNLSNRIAARLKILSNLDIAEKRTPQDGRFKLSYSPERTIDCRVSTCPTLAGEKVVVRLLDSNTSHLALDSLGFTLEQHACVLQALARPQGLILATGPTGSGKTATLYASLHHINTPERNILTIEDPVEISIPGMNQVNVNPKAGLTFTNALRSFLRQDPDVIMVGEIRDLETAEIAIKAAQTGHLVLSTLHANSAVEAITRLLNLGVPAFHLASSMSLTIAQRLIRTLCNHCKKQPTTLESPQAGGCYQCTQGYRGRTGIFEVVPISSTLNDLITTNPTATTLLKQVRTEGIKTLTQAGLDKIKEGITTAQELHRVTGNYA